MIGRAAGIALLVFCLGALMVWPACALVLDSMTGEPTDPPVQGLLTPLPDDTTVRPVRLALNTAALVGLTEVLALPPGIVLAFFLARTNPWGRRAMLLLLGLMLAVPLPLHAAAWLGAFGNLGRAQLFGAGPVLVGLPGAAVVHAIAALPWVVTIVGVGMLTVEGELEDAARLDMPARRVAIEVTLRRSWGFVAGAALAIAVLTAGDMTVTDLLSVRTYAEEAYLQFQIGRGSAAAAAVAIPPLLMLGGLLAAAGLWLSRFDPRKFASVFATPRRFELGAARIPVGLVLYLVVGTVAGLPIYALIWRAGRVGGDAALGLPPVWSVAGFLGSIREGWKAIWPLSYVDVSPWNIPALLARLARKPIAAGFAWSTCAAVVATAFAWIAAWEACRNRLWGLVVLGAAAVALATPGPVVGMSLVLAYRYVPAVYNTGLIVVAADVARVWPYALLILWPVLRGIPREYLDAAALDGVSAVRTVALPISAWATALAFVASFLLSFGELPASGLVAPPGLTTMPILIWSALHIGVESRLAAIALWNLFVFAVLVAGAFGLIRRSASAAGR